MRKTNRKTDIRNFKGGFIPDEVKTLEPRVRKDEKTSNWQESSDTERESLSDPRWHKRPPTARKQNQQTSPLHH